MSALFNKLNVLLAPWNTSLAFDNNASSLSESTCPFLIRAVSNNTRKSSNPGSCLKYSSNASSDNAKIAGANHAEAPENSMYVENAR